MENIITTLFNGLSAGGTYAMIALGYTMVYGIAKMLNFAHGDIIMVGGFTVCAIFNSLTNSIASAIADVSTSTISILGIALSKDFILSVTSILLPMLGMLAAMLVCMILGITIEAVAYRPLRGASPLAVLITAIGVSYMLQALAQIIFTSNGKKAKFLEFDNINLFGASISASTIVTVICSAIIMVVLSLFVKYTRTGRAMIAVSEDKGAAQLMGINVNKIITITFAIGSALAAVAGFFMLWSIGSVTPTSGALPGIKAFAAAVIGGIGSLPGAMLGGILMGVVEAFCSGSQTLGAYTDAIVFAVLIIILLVRPSGILGKKRREKV